MQRTQGLVWEDQLLALNVKPSRTLWKESSLKTTVVCNWGHPFKSKQTTVLFPFFTGWTRLASRLCCTCSFKYFFFSSVSFVLRTGLAPNLQYCSELPKSAQTFIYTFTGAFEKVVSSNSRSLLKKNACKWPAVNCCQPENFMSNRDWKWEASSSHILVCSTCPLKWKKESGLFILATSNKIF